MEDVLGPTYDYSSEIKTPGDIGVRMGDGSWGGITRAAAGVDYYSSVIGYGESTGMALDGDGNPKSGMEQHPMGLRYFIKSGGQCSNGADIYQYVNTIPSGLPGRLGKEIEDTLGVHLRGLAPGIFEDAAKALNPAPMFNAVTNSGFVACRKVSLPVGDANGNIMSAVAKDKTWWIDPSRDRVTTGPDGKPQVAHWIFDRWVSEEEYNATPKIYSVKDANGNVIENFQSTPSLPFGPHGMSQTGTAPLAAGVLFAALFAGLAAFSALRA